MNHKPKANVLAIIPARKGSKGLQHKNILMINGKPLVSWSIEQALNAEVISRVVVTSDCEKTLEIASKYQHCELIERPAALADDETPMHEVVSHVLQLYPNYDYLILLQPTSPLRTSKDIDEAFNKLTNSEFDSCVSVCPVVDSPYWTFSIDERSCLDPIFGDLEFTRRQDLPQAYKANGAIYIIKCSSFKKLKKFVTDRTLAYIMRQERSVDIDNTNDFRKCEDIFSNTR